MPLVVAEVLSAESLAEILREGKPIESVVEELFAKGAELASSITFRRYESWDAFRAAHAAGGSELTEVEGESRLLKSDLVLLLKCPMAQEMKKLQVDGKAPAFHERITNGYMEQNPGSNSVLHPGCIAHQVARQLAVKQLAVGGVTGINYYQLACRNMVTGKVVYDDNGLAAVGMTKDEAGALIDQHACLYVIVRS